MIGNSRKAAQGGGGMVIQFSLLGLIAFSVSLVLAIGGLILFFNKSSGTDVSKPSDPVSIRSNAVSATEKAPPTEQPPWGEIVCSEIELEPPEEYLAFELDRNWIPAWTFPGRSPADVRAFLAECGLTPALVESAMAPEFVLSSESGTVIHPHDDLVFSLTAESRTKLYVEMARSPSASQFIRFPIAFPGNSFHAAFADSRLDPAIISKTKRLLYQRGNVQCFSDYEVMLRQIPSETDRLTFLKVLSRQTGVLARLRIRPDTDIDKLLGYWGPGIEAKDVRPLLESVKRLPEGGTVSLLHLLPPFARQRLFTFPYDSLPGDPTMDCHWSTMNFFNEIPDNRFGNPAFTTEYIRTNLYGVAKPSLYGDILLFVDDNSHAVHSAVYLADDLVFTKNGNNAAQPWMTMRLKDLMARYVPDNPSRMLVYRQKGR